MREIILQKFTQNTDLKQKLCETGTMLMINTKLEIEPLVINLIYDVQFIDCIYICYNMYHYVSVNVHYVQFSMAGYTISSL